MENDLIRRLKSMPLYLASLRSTDTIYEITRTITKNLFSAISCDFVDRPVATFGWDEGRLEP